MKRSLRFIDLLKLSPSEKLVLLVLEREGPSDIFALESLTYLPVRTVRAAVWKLLHKNMIGFLRMRIDNRSRKIYYTKIGGTFSGRLYKNRGRC